MEKEDMKLIEQSVEFLRSISITNNDDDCNILSEAREKVSGVHRDLPDKISSNTDLAYFIIQDSKSAVINELNDVCNKLSDLSIKAGIQDYVASIQDDDDYTSYDDAADVDVDDDDDDDVYDDDGEISVYLKKKAYHAIKTVRAALSCTSDVAVSSSEDLSLMICKSRSQVENHLNVICNNVSNLTYKRDLSHHLIGFKQACLNLPNLPSQILDSSLDYTEWKRMSSRSEQKSKSCSGEAESGSGGCKSPIDIPENHEANDELGDIDYYYHYPNKCMEEEDERYYPRVIRIGNWDPKYEGQGISLLDPSALRDYSEDELDLTNMSEGSPNIHLLDELLTSMSEGSPKFHREDSKMPP
ncbi:hypothetical protein Tco_0801822 [Tanacetum coccineum]|uniref:Uncharacterized protein n=1 Tax=Tanacetum coccineum TaxID=301880 RepID=A0ABQ4ZX35_9ASTR